MREKFGEAVGEDGCDAVPGICQHDPGSVGRAVVAPTTSYSPGSLSAFQEEVNRGLAGLVSAKSPDRLDMDFCFEQLPADFDLSPGDGSAGALLGRRTAVYSWWPSRATTHPASASMFGVLDYGKRKNKRVPPPLKIDPVVIRDGQGVIGLTFCPDKKHQVLDSGAWRRDLRADLEVIQAFGATSLVTLMECAELDEVCVPASLLWRRDQSRHQ